jgi:nucleoside-diphosphate-sugar epimerase
MSAERFLVTGAYGCIGAWVLRQLVDEGVDVVVTDLGSEDHRVRLLLDDGERSALTTAPLDVTRGDDVDAVFDRYRPTNVLHLAALQVPFCAATPARGALVNVVGTVNVLQAAARSDVLAGPVAYASSIAAHPVPGDLTGPPTHYGVYKQANEGNAAVFWATAGLASIGLRPYVVYGVGRDQGVTSDPTKAMAAVAAGQAFHIGYGGRTQLQYAPDVAAAFIAAARAPAAGAHAVDLPGELVDMRELVDLIHECSGTRGLVTAEENQPPFPDTVDEEAFGRVVGVIPQTPLRAGIAHTVARFRWLAQSVAS